MKVEITNRQRKARIAGRRLRKLMEFLAARLEALDPDVRWEEVSVAIMDNRGIALVNGRHLGRREPTDVMSFHYAPLPADGNAHRGEICVNVERALEFCGGRRGLKSKARWDVSMELALYLAHGCDHLSGADDRDVRSRSRMRRRELAWLRQARRLGLARGLVGYCFAKHSAGKRRDVGFHGSASPDISHALVGV